jgi:cbb3-type cytochrome oxidase subunit 3
MKYLFASSAYGLIGLLLFFCLFIGILIWVFRPGSKEAFKKYGYIPLKDDTDER